MLANYYKDQEEDFEKYKVVCRFINPDAAHKLFDKDGQTEVIVPEDEFLKEINEHSRDKITAFDLGKSFDGPKLDTPDLDTIERIN